MGSPVAILVGFIGKLPLAGMALYNLHYAAGLRELGYDVFYVEHENEPGEYYDPKSNAMTEHVDTGLSFIRSVLSAGGIADHRFALIDRHRTCHGSGWPALKQVIASAEFVLNVADVTWFDELELCPRRAFVDGDPIFTQAAMLSGGATADALAHYDVLFTYAMAMGQSGCTVPTVGRTWLPTRPVVSTAMWTETHANEADGLPVTTVMNWSLGADIELEGRQYGQKGRELSRFMSIPARTSRRFTIALGGKAPRKDLIAHGWTLANPLEVTGTIAAYQNFIAGSYADFGIAKHAYVASRSGWFSDRGLCYLASGRPVLLQDTGFTDWLKVDHGVLPFTDPDSLIEALGRLERDYVRHSNAARDVAQTHFEARTVIGEMLDAARFR